MYKNANRKDHFSIIIQSPKLEGPYLSLHGLQSLPDTILLDTMMPRVSVCPHIHTAATNTYTVKIPQETETLPQDDFYAILEPCSDIKDTHLLGIFSKSRQIPHIHEENVQKHHVVVLEFLIF